MKANPRNARPLQLFSLLSKGGMYLSGAMVFVMALFITFEVIARRFLGFSTLVADEWSTYLLVSITFFGLAHTMDTKGFLQIEFLISRLSQRKRIFLHAFLLLFALAYSILIEYKLITYTWSTYANKVVSISIFQTPLFVPQLAMPIGMAVLILELVKQTLRSINDLFSGNHCHSEERL